MKNLRSLKSISIIMILLAGLFLIAGCYGTPVSELYADKCLEEAEYGNNIIFIPLNMTGSFNDLENRKFVVKVVNKFQEKYDVQILSVVPMVDYEGMDVTQGLWITFFNPGEDKGGGTGNEDK